MSKTLLEKGTYLTPMQAARRAGVTDETIRIWCRKYGIGRRVVNRYRVDPEALDHLINNSTGEQ